MDVLQGQSRKRLSLRKGTSAQAMKLRNSVGSQIDDATHEDTGSENIFGRKESHKLQERKKRE